MEKFFVKIAVTSIKIITMVEQQLVTTSNQLEGYRVSKHLGVVRGITVRSRSIFGNIAGVGVQRITV